MLLLTRRRLSLRHYSAIHHHVCLDVLTVDAARLLVFCLCYFSRPYWTRAITTKKRLGGHFNLSNGNRNPLLTLALVVLENKQIAEDVLTQQLLDETTQQFSQSEDSSYEEDVIQQHIFRAFDSSRSILSFSSHFRCPLDEEDLKSLKVISRSGQNLFLDTVLSSDSATAPAVGGEKLLPASSSVTKSLDEKKKLCKDALELKFSTDIDIIDSLNFRDIVYNNDSLISPGHVYAHRPS